MVRPAIRSQGEKLISLAVEGMKVSPRRVADGIALRHDHLVFFLDHMLNPLASPWTGRPGILRGSFDVESLTFQHYNHYDNEVYFYCGQSIDRISTCALELPLRYSHHAQNQNRTKTHQAWERSAA